MTAATTTNEYWELVRDHINAIGSLWGRRQVQWTLGGPDRFELVKQYSWTITDPETVAFVVEHSGGLMVDPMAGTGWWAHVLKPYGVEVACYDREPETNHWHKGHPLYAPVVQAEGSAVAELHPDETLFLSWPPYETSDGVNVVRAYRGNRVIFLGEGPGGCTGNDELFAEFETNWREVANFTPIQWFGIHDYVQVFERNPA